MDTDFNEKEMSRSLLSINISFIKKNQEEKVL